METWLIIQTRESSLKGKAENVNLNDPYSKYFRQRRKNRLLEHSSRNSSPPLLPAVENHIINKTSHQRRKEQQVSLALDWI
jgi:hypothetical protein